MISNLCNGSLWPAACGQISKYFFLFCFAIDVIYNVYRVGAGSVVSDICIGHRPCHFLDVQIILVIVNDIYMCKQYAPCPELLYDCIKGDDALRLRSLKSVLQSIGTALYTQ